MPSTSCTYVVLMSCQVCISCTHVMYTQFCTHVVTNRQTEAHKGSYISNHSCIVNTDTVTCAHNSILLHTQLHGSDLCKYEATMCKHMYHTYLSPILTGDKLIVNQSVCVRHISLVYFIMSKALQKMVVIKFSLNLLISPPPYLIGLLYYAKCQSTHT